MSKAPDKSHTLFINLFILVLPLSSAKENFLEGSQFHFCLHFFISFHQPAAVFCLCLPAFHKLCLEMSVSCLRQNLQPMTVLLNKKQACYGYSLCLKIKQINQSWSMHTIISERQHSGTYVLQCSFSVFEIWSESFWNLTLILSKLYNHMWIKTLQQS